MKLTADDITERKEMIIHTAFKLFCKQGIDRVTMLQISRSAGVGETTMYRYFDDKITLVQETFIRLWDTIMTHLEETVETTEDYNELTGIKQVEVWLKAFKALYVEHADFILFSYEAKLYMVRHKVHLSKYQQDILMHALKGPFINALEKGKADGSITSTLDNEDVFYSIWGAIRGYVVKIVVYAELYGGDSPWEPRYPIISRSILTMLRSGGKKGC